MAGEVAGEAGKAAAHLLQVRDPNTLLFPQAGQNMKTSVAGIPDFNFILAQNHMFAALWCQPKIALATGFQCPESLRPTVRVVEPPMQSPILIR
jgi:hypothetical protein